MPAHVQLPPKPVTIDPGGEAVCPAWVRNTALTADRFALELVGSAASWSTVVPPVLQLGPDSVGRIDIRFHPPRAPHVRAGQVPFALVATSERDRTAAISEQLLALQPFFHTELELRPRAAGRAGAGYRLLVSNGGNHPVRLKLRGRDRAGSLHVRCEPDQITVPPGGTEHSRVQVRVPRGLRLEPGVPVEFRVTAHADGRDPLLVAGLFTPRAARLTRLLR